VVSALDYGRNELLNIIMTRPEDYDGIKELPQIMNDMTSGHQEQYINAYFDGVFSGRYRRVLSEVSKAAQSRRLY
jgi:hypothetical protein